MNLFKFINFLITGPRCSIWPVLVMAGMSVAQGVMQNRSAKKQSRAIEKAAGEMYENTLKGLELATKDLVRNRKIADDNSRLIELQAEDAAYRSEINKKILENEELDILELVRLEEEKMRNKSKDAKAEIYAQIAASGLDVNSVSMEALLIDHNIETNQQVAELHWQGQKEQADLMFQKEWLLYESDLEQNMANLQKAFLLDDAEYTYTTGLDRIEIEKEAAAIEKEAGIVEAKGVRSEGRAALVSSGIRAFGSTFGSKEFRSDFSKWRANG